MVKIAELDPEEWSQFERGTLPSTPFHTGEWLTILERTYEAKILRIGFFEGNQLIGGMPILVKRKFIYRIAGSPLDGTATPYQGPICSDLSNYGRLFKAFLIYAESSKWDFVQITPFPGMGLEHWTLNSPYLRCEARQTLFLDLRPGEAKLFRAMRHDCRKNIKQAQARGLVVEEVDASERQWIEGYYEMAVEAYRRQRRSPPIPKSFFENLSSVLGTSGKIKLLFARYKSETVAAGIFLIHGGVIYAWDGVSRRAYSHLRASNLLNWTLIRLACANSLETFDMLGANIPTIAHFKQGFGGALIPYDSLSRSKGRLARFGESAYRFLAPAARRTLSFLSKTQ
jgi:hypothetical protein